MGTQTIFVYGQCLPNTGFQQDGDAVCIEILIYIMWITPEFALVQVATLQVSE